LPCTAERTFDLKKNSKEKRTREGEKGPRRLERGEAPAAGEGETSIPKGKKGGGIQGRGSSTTSCFSKRLRWGKKELSRDQAYHTSLKSYFTAAREESLLPGMGAEGMRTKAVYGLWGIHLS